MPNCSKIGSGEGVSIAFIMIEHFGWKLLNPVYNQFSFFKLGTCKNSRKLAVTVVKYNMSAWVAMSAL
jgi:hypothetical protein